MSTRTWFLIIILMATLLQSVFAQQATLQEEQDYRFAIQLEKKGLFDLAALQFERFASSYPMSTRAPEALFSSAQNYTSADSLAKAATIYKRILFNYPQSDILAKSQFQYAEMLDKHSENLKAALAFERIKILDPKSELVPDAQIEAAKNFLEADQLQKANDAALYILEFHRTHPSRLQAYFAIARVYEAKGDYKQALEFLDRMLGDRVADELAAKAYSKKANLLQKIGRYAQADSVLTKLVNGSYASPIVARAAVKLSESMLAQRDYKAATSLLNQSVSKVSEQDKAHLQMTLGDAYFLQKQWQEANDEYRKVAAMPGGDSPLFYYRLGYVAKSTGDFDSALQNFKHVLEDTSTSEPVFRYASFEYASALANSGRAVDGIRYLQQATSKMSSQNRDELYLHIAHLQEDYLRDYSGARQHYSAVIAGDPTSPKIDDAQFFYARTFDRQGESSSALNEYKRYLTYYPGGDYYQASTEASQRLQLFAPDKSSLTAFGNENIADGSLGTAAESAVLFNLAYHYLSTFHDYEKALSLLQQAALPNDEQIDKTRLDYNLALCHFALYEQSRSNKEPGKMSEHARQIAEIAERMITNYSASLLSEQVDFWNIQMNLPELNEDAQRVDFLQQHISRFQLNDSLKSSLQMTLVDEMIKALPDTSNTVYDDAVAILNKVIETQQGELSSAALYKKALLLNKMSYSDSAIVVLEELVLNNTAAEKSNALLLLALLHQDKSNLKKAQLLLEQISKTYYYSKSARKAEIKLISLLLQQEQFEQAKQRTEELKKRGAPKELRLFYPEKIDDESQWLWANVIRHTQSPHLAIHEFQRYLDIGFETPHAAEAMFAIAELANKLHKQEMALGYFEECAEQFPADSIGQQSLVKTADLYFERGQYERAGELYVKMKNQLSGDLQRLAFKQQIICEYKKGRLSSATNLVKQFKKKHDDRDAEARLLYEQGVYYVESKNLDKAEKAFKTLSNKYDDIPEGARGELGLARLYVIQTKTEDALKRLTKIPQEYDDPEIVATAYLNLADFYYENRALENCVIAGKQVLALREGGPMRAQAMDLLIGAYDDLGMRDQAIALQREYLQIYPYTNDALDRRIRIGTFLYYLKEYDRAVAQLKELAPIVPADEEARVRFWIAESYAAAGFTEQAIIEYLKVRYQCKQTKLPFGVTALYKAGDGYKKLENYSKAREMYELVVKERGATDDFGRAANRKIQEIEAILAEQS
jgi:tetratricopeptide (TPR) repeat protein